MKSAFTRILASSLLAVFAGGLVGAVFILMTGNNPVFVYGLMMNMTFGSIYGIGQLIFYATPLIFSGLAVAFAFRGGLFNIGCEGQIYMGGLLCAWTGWASGGLSPIIAVPLCVLAAAVGGAAWGGVAGILKAKTGAHEVITTIMMNFISFALVNYIVLYHFSVPETVRTPAISSGAVIGRLGLIIPGLRNSLANFTFVISLITAAAVWYVLYISRAGFEVRVTGDNRNAAKYAGVNLTHRVIYIMFISGALAGLSSINFVMGYKHYFEQGFSAGAGFMGIAVALLGRNQPLGVVIASFFFAFLAYGGLAVNSYVPKELIEMLQGIIILTSAAANTIFLKIYYKWRQTG